MAAVLTAAAGYTIGWMLNFFALAVLRPYSRAALLSAFLGGALPHSWEKLDASERVMSAQLRDKEDWRFAQSIGAFRYIFVRGGLMLGAIAFFCLHITLNFFSSQPIVLYSLPLKFLLWVLFGILITFPRWWALKRANRGEA